jgi:recombination protein RecA
MAAAHDLEALLVKMGARLGEKGGIDLRENLRAEGHGIGKLRLAPSHVSGVLELSWPGLNDVLPDGGLPRGVVEVAAARALGGSTSIALAAVRAGQAKAPGAWCAWLDPEGTLHAPGVVAAGVDLDRMLVVRPPRADLARIAVKVVGAGAFEVVVVDFDAVPGASLAVEAGARGTKNTKKRTWAPEVLVRKLALSAESSGSTVLLLTDSTRSRAVPWPVALRLELSRSSRSDLVVRVAKDRRGRIGLVKTVPFLPVCRSAG